MPGASVGLSGRSVAAVLLWPAARLPSDRMPSNRSLRVIVASVDRYIPTRNEPASPVPVFPTVLVTVIELPVNPVAGPLASVMIRSGPI